MSETKIKKCNFCGKDIKVPCYETRQVYCPTECLDKYQKHEKIEKMAWEMYMRQVDFQAEFWDTFVDHGKLKDLMLWSFQHAKEFYNYTAQLKQEEASDGEI